MMKSNPDKLKNDIFWQIRNKAEEDTAEILLYGTISNAGYDDNVSPKKFADDLKSLGGKDITLRINSPGGDVFAAQAIYNQLKSYPGNITAYIDGMAASAATIVTCAADRVVMPGNGVFMIHNPLCLVMDYMDVPKLEKLASSLKTVKQTIVNVYMKKCRNVTESKLNRLMDAETWMSAEDAVNYGFVDEMDADWQVENSLHGSTAIVNNISINLSDYNQPDKLKNILQGKQKEDEKMDEKTLLNKLCDLLGVKSQQEEKPDPVALERKRMLDLDAMRDGSEIVDKLVDIAKRNGNTAEEIRDYVAQVKESNKDIVSQQAGIEEIRNLVKDQLKSGAENVVPVPAEMLNESVVSQAAEVEALTAAMKKVRGEM